MTPAARAPAFLALLRGINVGGRRMPMDELRAIAHDLGWRDVRSYIQSGNLVFRAPEPAGRPVDPPADPPDRAPPDRATLEATLEEALHARYGFPVAVLVRAAAEWDAMLAGNPFPEAAAREPGLVMVAVSKAAPAPDAVAALLERADAGERIVRNDDVLWIHYAAGAGRSKVSPGLLDRAVGSPVTTRNWRTALKLAELARS